MRVESTIGELIIINRRIRDYMRGFFISTCFESNFGKEARGKSLDRGLEIEGEEQQF